MTERAPILATLRRLPNQAFPLSLFPCEESRLERSYTVRVSGLGQLHAATEAQDRAFGRGATFGLREKLKACSRDQYREVGGRTAGQQALRAGVFRPGTWLTHERRDIAGCRVKPIAIAPEIE